ncbi:MAG: 2-oxoglutarate dehydrogenase E1 component [Zavarzinella sp.]
MHNLKFANRYNLEFIEQQYQLWSSNPENVDPQWQAFFEGFELSAQGLFSANDTSYTSIVRLIQNYRNIGHLQAQIDPLADPPGPHAHLSLEEYGLSEKDLDRYFDCSAFHGMNRATLRELLAVLQETYCGTVGVEYGHIQDNTIRDWLKARIEPRRMRPEATVEQQKRTLNMLVRAENFEQFLAARYPGQKRFSLEGGETLMPVLEAIIERGPSLGIREFVLGMSHRGRLNVLANTLRKPPIDIFAEFEDNFQPDSYEGDGDVKYHLGFSSDYQTSDGNSIHLSLTPNPSHLEAVDAVVEGRTRAKQRLHRDKERRMGVPILIHGDAAFAGQGIVAEVFNLANVEGYTTGGTVHIIVNNQIGFTTSPQDGRSTQYCTDISKMIQAPVFHVNAEDPDSCVFIAELAIEFRQHFRRDVIIDINCYRKWGHNEGDEPGFMHPKLYNKINKRKSIALLYQEQLIRSKRFTEAQIKQIVTDYRTTLDNVQQQVKKEANLRTRTKSYGGPWTGMQAEYRHEATRTGVSRELLEHVITVATTIPTDVKPFDKIERILDQRRESVLTTDKIDWATAECLAFGSLVAEGTSVRLSGQDSRRGTFSQRHAIIVDQETLRKYNPIDQLSSQQSFFRVYDSPLSEEAVLGFELGFSFDAPNTLVLWEAQFGDFVNGAQSIIDQYLICSETKWQRSSGLVLLLPHGYEGQGPEHSSGRLERFLQSCAENNIQVCNLTTPAQYFHVLRRQMRRDFRKPLIIMTPKSLLRHKMCVSTLSSMTNDHFHEVIDDQVPVEDVKRVLMCSGKLYYELLEARGDRTDIALVRMEQFYPFPEQKLSEILSQYTQAEMVWVQEESQNMGGWQFIEPRIRGMGYEVSYVGRDPSASPAVGSLKLHKKEQELLISTALNGESGSHMIAQTKLIQVRAPIFYRYKQTH